MNARSTIHALWNAFVPSASFLVLYVVILLILVGTSALHPVQAAVTTISEHLSARNVRQLAEQLEVLKLLPLVVVFIFAFALYLFDKVVLGIGHSIPPHISWAGSPTAFLPDYLVRGIWQLLDRPRHLSELDMQVDRLVNLARAEQKDFLLSSLVYVEERFSFAANLVAYVKAALLWVAVCAVWSISAGQTLGGLFVPLLATTLFVLLLGLLFVTLETHYLIEMTERKARIAEGMLQLQGKQYRVGAEFDEEAYEPIKSAIGFQSTMRFIRLRWGSLDELRRAVRFFVPRAQQRVPADGSRAARSSRR